MLTHRTKNPGILEAFKEINLMNLSDWMKAQHEFNLREERDKAALEEQIRRDASAQGLAEGRAQGLAEGRAEGLQQGLEQGLSQGLELKLIKQVQTKLKKGMQVEQIAGELEELLANVDRICKAVDKCGMDADPSEVYRQLQ